MKKHNLFKQQKTDHGGDLKHAQKRARPLSTHQSMHLVLRSTQAKGKMSFYLHKKAVDQILQNFADKYQIELKSSANVGNHIHLHIKLTNRKTYIQFIRAVTAAIMMKVTGFCRDRPKPLNFQFWDRRPFTKIVSSITAFQNLVDYIQINVFESMGYTRSEARYEVKRLRFEFQCQKE